MEPGDFVITPPMTWHDHGQSFFRTDVSGSTALDIPVVQFLDAFLCGKAWREAEQPDHAKTAAIPNARYGSNLLPVDLKHFAKGVTDFQLPVRGRHGARP